MKTALEPLKIDIEISAVCDAFAYMDMWELADDLENGSPLTLGELLAEIETAKMNKEQQSYYELLVNAVKHDSSLASLELVDQSPIDTPIPSTELIACTFRHGDDYYIAYRGTGDGKWPDNADAMTEEFSWMQRRAQEYFDHVVETYDLEHTADQVILTGHSKGGNSAQFAMMYSEYGDLVDRCYSFDGQGFSEQAIARFRANWGDDYEAMLDRMYSINGQNDYVHDLGYAIIPEGHTYFMETTEEGFVQYHSLEYLFSRDPDTSGDILNWSYTEDGSIHTELEQGDVGKFAKELSEAMMKLPPEERDDCAIAVMSLLEKLNMVETDTLTVGTGDRASADIEEWFGGAVTGIPLILNVALHSEHLDGVLEAIGADSDIRTLLANLQEYVALHDIEDIVAYILEDPVRLVEIYQALDLENTKLHESISTFFSPQNIGQLLASFVVEHPVISAVGVMAASSPVAVGCAKVIVNCAVLYTVSSHVWTKLCEDSDFFRALDQTADQIRDKVAGFFSDVKEGLEVSVNAWLSSAFVTAERLTSVCKRFVYGTAETAGRVLNVIEDAARPLIKSYLKRFHPILYGVSAKLYGMAMNHMTIDATALQDCVSRMDTLASRLITLDDRLDGLYGHLSLSNIDMGDGIFTSIANLYNLYTADLCVDEGWMIRRKANALEELYGAWLEAERTVQSLVPQET